MQLASESKKLDLHTYARITDLNQSTTKIYQNNSKCQICHIIGKSKLESNGTQTFYSNFINDAFTCLPCLLHNTECVP